MLDQAILQQTFPSIKIELNQSAQKFTTMGVGGLFDMMITPKSIQETEQLLQYFSKNNIPYFILGKGSNLIVNDNGVRIPIINMQNLTQIMLDESDSCVIHAEAGVELSQLSLFALEHGLEGLEFAEGIPGTVGGAVFMNAGAYGSEIKNILESSLIFHENLITLSNIEHEFAYRCSSIMKNNAVVLKTSFRLNKGNKKNIKDKMDDLHQQRADKQPLEMHSAGSTFKRPEGYFAGKLISDSGLQGVQKGGASVSLKHAGFVINSHQAKAQDILELIAYIQKEVYQKFHVYLEPEVRFLKSDGTLYKF